MDKISVIVPVYNAESTIRRCMDSLINQQTNGLFNYEVVVVDDGSKDSTPPLLDSYTDSYVNVTVYHIPNGGVSAARKYAIEHSQSDFIAFCDSDDFVDTDWLLTMYNTLKDSNADFSRIICYLNDDKIIPTPNNPVLYVWDKTQAIELFIEHRLLNGILWNNLFKRKLFDDLDWRHEMTFAEDSYLMWQIIQKVNRVAKIEAKKYHYMLNPSSLSHAKFSFKMHRSVRTLFDRIVYDCIVKPELLPFTESARQWEYKWTLSFLKQSVRSNYPEANDVEREMIALLRKRGFKGIFSLDDNKSRLTAIVFILSPTFLRNLLRPRD